LGEFGGKMKKTIWFGFILFIFFFYQISWASSKKNICNIQICKEFKISGESGINPMDIKNSKLKHQIDQVPYSLRNAILEVSREFKERGINIKLLANRGDIFDIKSKMEDGNAKHSANSFLSPDCYLCGEIRAQNERIISITAQLFNVDEKTIASCVVHPYNPSKDSISNMKELATLLLNQKFGIQEKGTFLLKPEDVVPNDFKVTFILKDQIYKKQILPIKMRLEPGNHFLFIEPTESQYYKSTLINFRMKPGGKKNFSENKINLERHVETLCLNNLSKNALVFIDGKRIQPLTNAKEKFSVNSGKRVLTIVNKNGFICFDQVIDIRKGMKNHNFLYPAIFMAYLKKRAQKRIIAKSEKDEIIDINLLNDTIYLIDNYGVLEAVDALDHHRKWTFSDYPVLAGPFSMGKRFFVVCQRKLNPKVKRLMHKLVEIAPDSGAILWETPEFESTWIKGISRNDRLILIFNNYIFYVNPDGEKPKKISTEKKRYQKLDWKTAEIMDSGIIMLNMDKDLIGLKVPFENAIETIKRKVPDDYDVNIIGNLIIKEKKDYIKLFDNKGIKIDCFNYKTNMFKEYKKREMIFFKFDQDTIYAIRSDCTEYWNINIKARKVKHDTIFLPKDTSKKAQYLTDFVVDPFGQFIMITNSSKVTLYSPEMRLPLWIYDLSEPIKRVESTKSFLTIGTTKGNLITIGQSRIKDIIGWIETEKETGTKIIKFCENYSKVKTGKEFLVGNINNISYSSLGKNPKIYNPQFLKNKIHKIQIKEIYKNADSYKANFIIKDGNISDGDVVLEPTILNIQTDPPSSYVFVNGFFAGKSPKYVFNIESTIESSEYEVHIFKKDYEKKIVSTIQNDIPITQKIKLIPFNIELEKSKNRKLYIFTKPKGLNIIIDGKKSYNNKEDPKTMRYLRKGQVVSITLNNRNYRKKIERIKILNSIGNDIANKITIKRTFKPLNYYDFFLLMNRPDNSTIIGWKGGIEGVPVRLNFTSNIFYMGFRGELSFNNFRIGKIKLDKYSIFGKLATYNFLPEESFKSQLNLEYPYINEFEIGIKYLINSFPIVGDSSFGLSLNWIDINAWDNTKKNYEDINFKFYLNGYLFFRPKDWAIIHIKGSHLLKGFFTSTSFSQGGLDYINSKSGNSFGIGTVIQLLKKFPIRFIANYDYAVTSFKLAKERGHSFSLGFSFGFTEYIYKKF
jgi:hypothetical protein